MAKAVYKNGKLTYELTAEEKQASAKAIQKYYTQEKQQNLITQTQQQAEKLSSSSAPKTTTESVDLTKTMNSYEANLKRLNALGYDVSEQTSAVDKLKQQRKDYLAETKLIKTTPTAPSIPRFGTPETQALSGSAYQTIMSDYQGAGGLYKMALAGKTPEQKRTYTNKMLGIGSSLLDSSGPLPSLGTQQQQETALRQAALPYMPDEELTVDERQGLQAAREKRLAEVTAELDGLAASYASAMTENNSAGEILPKNEEVVRRYNRLLDEQDRLTVEVNTYKRTQEVLDRYSGVQQKAASSNFSFDKGKGSTAKEALKKLGNLENRSQKDALSNVDKLGAFLSSTKEERDTAIAQLASHGSVYGSVMLEGVDGGWEELKHQERQTYYYLLNTEGRDAADKYLEDMKIVLNKRQVDAQRAEIDKASGFEKFMLNLASIPGSVFGGVTALAGSAGDALRGKEFNPYSSAFSVLNATKNLTEVTAEDINEATGGKAILGITAGDVYQATMSGLTSLVGATTLGPAYSVVMGMNSAASRAQELYELGASERQIAAGALLSGAAEMVFEKVSLEHFLDMPSLYGLKGREAVKQLVVNVLSQGGVEASEETFTEIAGIISDTLVRGEASNWNQLIAYYVSEGEDVTSARAHALVDMAVQTYKSAAGGFISGFLMSGGGSAIDFVQNAKDNNRLADIGRDIVRKGQGGDQVQTLVSAAMNLFSNGSEGRQLAVKLKDQLSAGKTGKGISDIDLGRLYLLTKVEQQRQFAAKQNQEQQELLGALAQSSDPATAEYAVQQLRNSDVRVASPIMEKLTAAGVKKDMALTQSDLLYTLSIGEALTSSEVKSLYFTSPAVRQIFTQLTGVEVPQGAVSTSHKKELCKQAVDRVQQQQKAQEATAVEEQMRTQARPVAEEAQPVQAPVETPAVQTVAPEAPAAQQNVAPEAPVQTVAPVTEKATPPLRPAAETQQQTPAAQAEAPSRAVSEQALKQILEQAIADGEGSIAFQDGTTMTKAQFIEAAVREGNSQADAAKLYDIYRRFNKMGHGAPGTSTAPATRSSIDTAFQMMAELGGEREALPGIFVSRDIDLKARDLTVKWLNNGAAKRFGVKVELGDLPDVNGQTQNAHYDEETRTIILNQKVVTSQFAVTYYFVHEITHTGQDAGRALNGKTDTLTNDILAAMKKIFGEARFDELAQRTRDAYKNAYLNNPEDVRKRMIEDEVAADFMMRAISDLNLLDRLTATNRGVVAKFRDHLEAVRRGQPKDVKTGRKELNKLIDRMTQSMERTAKKPAETKEKTATEGGDVRNSFVGYAEDGKGMYKSNFPKGTPKAAKAERILHYIQNVWSKQPITLRVEDENGARYIQAQYDPTYDPAGTPSDASKLMGGNRHGSSGEQRVTLDLADDYYQIAAESRYNGKKEEVGKTTEPHQDVRQWLYFVNDIYFAEYDSDEYEPYRVSINVKEKSDGHFVYSYSAEKAEKYSPQRTLHAAVSADEDVSTKGILSDDTVTQEEPVVKSTKRNSLSPIVSAEEAKANNKAALDYFGRTYNWNETGYILLDGSRLDFSGKHDGGPGGYRTVDHREIRDALGDDYGGDDHSGSLVQFMREGNVRIMPESAGINLSVLPTKAQLNSLSDFISKNRGEVILDIDNLDGQTVSSTEYPRGTHANKVIADIKRYFETGEKPQVSQLAQFRYSIGGVTRSYAPVYYSKMARVVDSVKQEKLGAASVVSMLRGKGVKAEEIKWSGIEQWLAGKKSVTKAELQNFIAANELKIDEETLDDRETPMSAEQEAQIASWEQKRNAAMDELEKTWIEITGAQFPYSRDAHVDATAIKSKLFNMAFTAANDSPEAELFSKRKNELYQVIYANDYFGFDSAAQAYQYIGSDVEDAIRSYEMSDTDAQVLRNFAEALEAKNAVVKKMTVSEQDVAILENIARHIRGLDHNIDNIRNEHKSEDEKWKTNWREYKLDGGENYREYLFKMPGSNYSNSAMDTHWGYERPGVLAHARVQDFDTSDGKMLFIEEIQSDWHNAGHKEGYVPIKFATVDNTELRLNDNTYELFYNGESLGETVNKEFAERRFPNGFADGSIHQRLVNGYNRHQEFSSAAPEAPFRDTYHEYALKRLLRMAAEDGYDSIGWTTAQQQAARWSEDYAEGYRIEYDQDIPKFLNKYGKQWGAKVGKTALPGTDYAKFQDEIRQGEVDIAYWEDELAEAKTDSEREFIQSQIDYIRNEIKNFQSSGEVWSMPITDAMRESVLYEGQPRFSLSPDTGYEEGTIQDRTLKLLQTGTLDEAVELLQKWAEDVRAGKVDVRKEEEALRDQMLKAEPVTPEEAAMNRDKLNKLIDKYGEIKPGMNRARPVFIPKMRTDDLAVSKLARSLAEAEGTPEWFKEEVERAIVNGDWGFTHTIYTDKAAMQHVEEAKTKGFEQALTMWNSLVDTKAIGGLATGMITKGDIAVGEWLYMETVKAGDIAGATKIAAELAAIGTQAGQIVQAMSLLKKMTPEGQLYYLTKAVDRMNAQNERKSTKKKTKAEKQQAADLEAKRAKAETDLYEAQKNLETKTAELEELQTTLADLNAKKTELKDAESDVKRAQKKLERLQSEWSQAAADAVQEELSRVTKELNEARGRKEEHRKNGAKLMRAKATLEKLQKAWDQNAAEALLAELADTKADIETLRDMFREYRKTEKALERAQATLEKLQSMWNQAAADVAKERLMDAKRDISEEAALLKEYKRVLRALKNAEEKLNTLYTEKQTLEPEEKAKKPRELKIFAATSEQAQKMLDDLKNADHKLEITRAKVNTAKEWLQKCRTEVNRVKSEIKKLNADIEERNDQRFRWKKPQKLLTINQHYAEQLLNAKTQKEIDEAMDKLTQDIADQIPNTFMEMWNAWRYLSMLGNVRTHGRNLVSNAIMTPVTFFKDMVGVLPEVALSRDNKTKHLGQAFASLGYGLTFGAVKANKYTKFAAEDAKRMKDILTGGGKHNPSDMIRDKRRPFGRNKLLNALYNANSKALEFEDWMFLNLHYNRALSQYLAAHKADLDTLETTESGRELLAKARDWAVQEAHKATFRDASQLATALNQLERSGLAGQLIVGGVMPYKKTPINILKRGWEYNPLSIITKGVKALKNESSAAEFVDGLASSLTGTAIMWVGLTLFRQGLLRAGGADDEKEREFEELRGMQSYSLQLLNGKNYTLDWAAPAALPLFIGAEIGKLMENGQLTGKNLGDVMMLMAEPMFQMTMLDGLNRTLKGTGYSDNPSMNLISNVVLSYFGQGVPTIFGQIARIIDPYRRSTYIEADSKMPKWLDRFWQSSVQSKTPVYANGRAMYLDAWGRAETQGTVVNRFFSNMVSPGYADTYASTPMEDELLRLYKATGDATVLPRDAAKYFNVTSPMRYDPTSGTFSGRESKRYDLSQEEWTTYQTVRGQTAYQLLTELTNSAEYLAMTDEQKLAAVKKLWDYADVKGKETAVERFKDNTSWIIKADALAERGLSVVDSAVFNVLEADSDADFKTDLLGMTWLTDAEKGEVLAMTKMMTLEKDLTIADPDKTKYEFILTEPQMQEYLKKYDEIWKKEYEATTGNAYYAKLSDEAKVEFLTDMEANVTKQAQAWAVKTLKAAGVKSTESPAFDNLALRNCSEQNEIVRLYDATGKNTVLPSDAPANFTSDGKAYNLSAAQALKYREQKEATQNQLLSATVKGAAYKGMDDEQKASTVSKLYTYANELAREKAAPGYHADTAWVNKAKDLSTKGVKAETYIAQSVLCSESAENDILDRINMDFLSDNDRGQIIAAEYTKKLTGNTFSDPNKKNHVFDLTDAQVSDYEDYYTELWMREYTEMVSSKRYINADPEDKAEMTTDLRGEVADDTKDWMARQLRAMGISSRHKDA